MSVAISSNYSGRTVDLFIFQGAKATGKQKITMSFGDVWQLTTGVQKVAQTFTTVFLTDKGSIYDQPEYGTGFITAMQAGSIQTESGLRNSFGLAVADVKAIMRAAATASGLPEDEQLDSAELLDYTMDKASGKITLNIGITTVAGTTTTIYVPVSVPIR